jgi:hypothetical protein
MPGRGPGSVGVAVGSPGKAPLEGSVEEVRGRYQLVGAACRQSLRLWPEVMQGCVTVTNHPCLNR